MNTRSILNKVLLLVPVVLVAPLLSVAAPATICTQTLGGSSNLTLISPVSFVDNTFSPTNQMDAQFTCPGATFTPTPFIFGNDLVSLGANTIAISSDISAFGPDSDVVFYGSTFPTGPTLIFRISDVLPPGMPPMETLSVSATPEPGSILLFGTGLLIAGGFIRRRLLVKTFA
jgi:PEP-CTERM motif